MKDVSIDIVLDDDPPRKPARPVGIFRGTMDIDEDLSFEELKEAQIRYLQNGVLGSPEIRSQEGDFQYRFNFDLEGTSHWEGLFFTVGVVDGECFLRLLNVGDLRTHRSRMESTAALRWSMRNAISQGEDGKTVDEVKKFSVLLPIPWSKVGAEDLWNALQEFRIAYVMME